MTVTFLRMRPAESLAEPTAVSRRREGTTAIELEHPTSADLTAASKAGVLVAATRIGEHEPAAWVLPPEEALRLGPPGWRLTVLDEGSREHVLDALARTGARAVAGVAGGDLADDLPRDADAAVGASGHRARVLALVRDLHDGAHGRRR